MKKTTAARERTDGEEQRDIFEETGEDTIAEQVENNKQCSDGLKKAIPTFSENSGAPRDVKKTELQDRDQADPGKHDKSIFDLLHFFSLKMDILKNP